MALPCGNEQRVDQGQAGDRAVTNPRKSRASSALGALVGAGAATLGWPGEAAAAPIVVPASGSITIDHLGNVSSSNPLEFDLDGQPGPDVSFSATSSSPSTFEMGTHWVMSDGEPDYLAQALSLGELIPSVTGVGASGVRIANLFDLISGTADGNFVGASEPLFAGFYFSDLSGIHAAWAQISIEFGDDSATLHVHRLGYESDVATGIQAGVPEPGAAGLALMASGAAGIAVRRRRREPGGQAVR